MFEGARARAAAFSLGSDGSPRIRYLRLRASRALRGLVLAASGLVTIVVGIALLATSLGYDLFVINGGSMEPSVPAGALVISERVAPTSLDPGDVITFRRLTAPDSPVTHRVIRVEPVEGNAAGVQIWTKGDANQTADPEPVTSADPVSVMRVSLPLAGYILAFVRTLPGQVLLVGMPLAFVAVHALLGWREEGRGRRSEERPRAAVTPLGRLLDAPRRLAAASPRMPRIALPSRRPSIGAATVTQSRRAARIHHAAQEPTRLTAELTETLRRALAPVEHLSLELDSRAAEFEASMARSLRPMTDYADQLEANLERLVERLGEDNIAPGSPIARQVAAERARLAEVRAAIEEAKEPLRASLRREAGALDAVLAPFDPDMESLEMLLQQQRRRLVKIVAGLQSDQFHDALDLLNQRSGELRTLAALGETDAAEVSATLGLDGVDEDPAAQRSPFVAAALAALLDEVGDTGARTDDYTSPRPASAA